MPNPSFFCIATQYGEAQIANAIANSGTIHLTKMVIGDGGGAAMTPNSTMTGLIRQVWEGDLTSVFRDALNLNWVHAISTIPAASGPFTIRELGILDSSGNLFAVANYPDTYKPVPSDGVSNDVTVEVIIIASDTAQITIQLTSADLVPLTQLLRMPFVAVNSATVTTPPASPTIGDMYRVAVGSGGVWTGKDNLLTQYDGNSWQFGDAYLMTIIGVGDTGIYLQRTASGWKQVLLPTLGKIRFYAQGRGHYGEGNY